MKKWTLLLGLWACLWTVATADSIPTYNFKIQVKAIDLSEDGVPGATMNDEVVMLVYKEDSSMCLPQTLFSGFFTMDSLKRTRLYGVQTDSVDAKDTYTIALLERDTRKSVKALDAICKIYLSQLYAGYVSGTNKVGHFELLDDDDILGFWRFSGAELLSGKPMMKKFESMNYFDWAVYKLEIKR